jgi:hypothetical protein
MQSCLVDATLIGISNSFMLGKDDYAEIECPMHGFGYLQEPHIAECRRFYSLTR